MSVLEELSQGYIETAIVSRRDTSRNSNVVQQDCKENLSKTDRVLTYTEG